jgi:hypothetical protein
MRNNQNGCMNKKDILFFNKKLKYTFYKSTPTTQFVQRVQLSSEKTVQWHKLWQLPGDRKRTYITHLFSEYMLTFRVE